MTRSTLEKGIHASFRPMLMGLLAVFAVINAACMEEPTVSEPSVTPQVVETNTQTPTRTGTATATSSPVPTATPLPTETPRPTFTPTPDLEVGSTKVSPIDGMTMVYIPAGSFQMGNETGENDRKPVHEVVLDAFWMDEHEVTNAQYARFLNEVGNQMEGGDLWYEAGDKEAQIHKEGETWSPEEGYADHPAMLLTWYGARAYCEWAGRRLPTEAEWEKAARGGLKGKTYPWGDRLPVCTPGAENGVRFWDCSYGTVPVKTFQPNGYGLYDMVGNTWEWVSDWYDYTYYWDSPRENPRGPSEGEKRVLRGGSWSNYKDLLPVYHRFRVWPFYANNDYGFRCVAPAPQ